MKQVLFTISSLIIVTSLFIACSNDMDDYCTKTDQCIYTEYIELSTNMSPDVKLKNLKEAEQRILDNIRIIDGKISLSHITPEELSMEQELFRTMKILFENVENPYDIIIPRTRSSILSSGESEQEEPSITPELAYNETLAMFGDVNSSFEKACLYHFFMGNGETKTIGSDDWSNIKKHAESKYTNTDPSSSFVKVQISFYDNTDYDYALGTASVTFDNKGCAIALYDYYDFDRQPEGNRSESAETATTIMSYLSLFGNPYEIKYGQNY